MSSVIKKTCTRRFGLNRFYDGDLEIIYDEAEVSRQLVRVASNSSTIYV